MPAVAKRNGKGKKEARNLFFGCPKLLCASQHQHPWMWSVCDGSHTRTSDTQVTEKRVGVEVPVTYTEPRVFAITMENAIMSNKVGGPKQQAPLQQTPPPASKGGDSQPAATENKPSTAVQQHYFNNQFETGGQSPVSAGDVGGGVTVAGAPAQLLDDVAQQSARTVRTYADAARTRMAHVFAEGGEEALRASQAHRAAANLETAATRTASSASRIRAAGTALNVAGGVLTGVDQYNNSNAQTTTGRATSATGAGSLAVAVGARHPYLAAADAAANLLGAPETPSNVLNRSVDTIATVGEGLITGDTRGMENLHQRNLRGDHGPVFQAAAEAGDFWAEHGVAGGLSMFGDAVGDSVGELWDSIF